MLNEIMKGELYSTIKLNFLNIHIIKYLLKIYLSFYVHYSNHYCYAFYFKISYLKNICLVS